MAEFLIKAQDAPVPDGPGKWHAARIVFIGEDGHTWGNEEGPPAFYIIKVPGVSVQDAEQYLEQWRHRVSLSVTSDNAATGDYTLRLTSSRVSLTGKNGFSPAQVQNYFQGWNATAIDVQPDYIEFDISVFDAVTSFRFWAVDVSAVVFVQTDYDQASGDVTVQIQSSPYSNAQMRRTIEASGGTVIPPDSFKMNRSVARAALVEDIKRRLEKISYDRRRWYIKASGMAALQSAGGIMTVTPAQFANHVSDGLQD